MLRTTFRSKIWHLDICSGRRRNQAVRTGERPAPGAEAFRLADLATAVEELDFSARTRCSASTDTTGVVGRPLRRRCGESASGAMPPPTMPAARGRLRAPAGDREARSALPRKRVPPSSRNRSRRIVDEPEAFREVVSSRIHPFVFAAVDEPQDVDRSLGRRTSQGRVRGCHCGLPTGSTAEFGRLTAHDRHHHP